MMEWISVDDRLPEIDGKYKTKSDYYEDGKVMIFRKVVNWSEKKTDVWFNDESSITSSVTHWAEPPQ